MRMRMIPELLAGLLFAGLLPAEAGNRYAENFVLEQKQSHQLLTIHNPLAGNRAEQRFALVSGEDSPPDLPTDCR